MLIDPEQLPRLAVPFMNEDHRQEARLINEAADRLEELRLGKAGVAQVNAAIDTLYAHSREHFTREETAMMEASFPATSFHQAEHVRILGELGEAQRRFQESGNGDELAAYLESFPSWFEQHITSMDSVTARYVAEWGG